MSWASVALDSGSNYIITGTPVSTSTELQTTHNVKLVISAPTSPVDYTGSQTAVEVNFSIVVAAPSCDCTQQQFDVASTASVSAAVGSTTPHSFTAPAQVANNYDLNPAMRACTSPECSTGGTFSTVTMADDSSLPSWITHSSGSLSITPDSGSL